MKVEVSTLSDDTTSLSYWLNWRVLICAIWVLMPMAVASWTIWKYERVESTRHRRHEAWRPCLKQIHPIWLLFFRIFSFLSLLATLVSKVFVSGARMYFYYTQWTFTLLTLYFGYGSLLSVVGCFHYMTRTKRGPGISEAGGDTEQGLLVPDETKELGQKRNASDPREKNDSVLWSLGIWTYLFEILFQVNAGAVMLTDVVYWFIIFPFLTIQDYSPSLLAIAMHSMNAVLLLGDAALNCLEVPLVRFSFFILWTGSFVIFQWIVHACVSIWWPYPFLDLSSPYAPLWYLLVAVMHVPCYGLFSLIVKTKRYFMAKLFPHSFHC